MLSLKPRELKKGIWCDPPKMGWFQKNVVRQLEPELISVF